MGIVCNLREIRKNWNSDAYRSCYQIASVLSVSYLCISAGNLLGYTSSAVPSMNEDLETFPEGISHHDISWIGGLGPIGALTGSLFTLIPLPRIGTRRTMLMLGAPSLIASWLIIGCAESLDKILFGRFLGGIGTGIAIACAPLYVVEISSVHLRGRLGILPQFLMIFGILTSYVLGSGLNWNHLALAGALITLPSMVLLILAPDSPAWLISRSREDEALKILKDLHGQDEGLKLYRQMQGQTRVISKNTKRTINTGTIKASAVALGVLSFQQLTGINGVTFYAVSIFREASGNNDMNPHIPCITVALAQLVGSLTSISFVERFGRTALLKISSFLLTMSGTCLGSYFFWGIEYPNLHWVPLVILPLFAFGFCIGFGPVAWILTAEILPSEVRHFMNPLAIAYNWFCAFIVAKSFPLLLYEIRIYGVFWLYAGIALLAFLFVTFCVPETKGKSPEEIRRMFDNSSSNVISDADDMEETRVISHCDDNPVKK